MLTKTTLFLPDAHIGEHDPLALACAWKIGKWLAPDEVVSAGDWLECAEFSSHARKTMPPEKVAKFRETELDPCVSFIREALWQWAGKWVYLEGNHENRVERFCANSPNGHTLWDVLSPRAWMEGIDGVTWIPYQAGPKEAHYEIHPGYYSNSKRTGPGASRLIAVHGWAHGLNSERQHLNRSGGSSILHGHTHAFRWDTKPLVDGPTVHSMSPGCLRTLTPAWLGATPQPWSHGVTIIYHGRRSWTPCMVPIENGIAYVEGHRIEATRKDVEKMHKMMGVAA